MNSILIQAITINGLNECRCIGNRSGNSRFTTWIWRKAMVGWNLQECSSSGFSGQLVVTTVQRDRHQRSQSQSDTGRCRKHRKHLQVRIQLILKWSQLKIEYLLYSFNFLSKVSHATIEWWKSTNSGNNKNGSTANGSNIR